MSIGQRPSRGGLQRTSPKGPGSSLGNSIIGSCNGGGRRFRHSATGATAEPPQQIGYGAGRPVSSGGFETRACPLRQLQETHGGGWGCCDWKARRSHVSD
jgi:hypothetical protein